VKRRFAVIGQRATASDEFLLDDLPGTSGRLDVLVRCLRAALLSSHGVRRDVIVYLVLLGGARAPRVVRVEGATAQFLRPDERSLAVLVRKVLASHADDAAVGFVDVRPGIRVARGGLEVVLEDAAAAGGATFESKTLRDVRPASGGIFILDESAGDIRDEPLDVDDALFVIGDHLGIAREAEALLEAVSARRVSVGPTSVHADDVVAVVTNELDRRGAKNTPPHV
jgi:tRNA (pseudouridine54-N1)-methyltransferase